MHAKINQIFHDILNAYGDLKKPNFHFVMESYNSLKYQSILHDIYSLFKVIDNTDLNYDVCISLQFEHYNKPAFLYLSLVSTYAFFYYENKVINCIDTMYHEFSDLINILFSYGFILLNKNELLYEFDIDTSPFNVENQKASVLALLFSFGLSISENI
ncbi:hypothetical protein GY065_12645 [Snodgrassella sp. ESL0323]|uniref:hypothetical protein n=1 Tax=Snodgrassella sp. ESL0323 TaxID=2705034 RepID=UPI001583238D|nr:hypothetical protein [Snodgrassella sp. ESL0323]NUF79746.1 hypothetical protein [Snodgrassella sp. ESL0323]